MANKIINYKHPSEYWVRTRQANWYGATSLVALAIIFLLGSLASLGIYLTRAFPLLNSTEAVATVAGSLAAGGGALLIYGIYTLSHHARQGQRENVRQAKAFHNFYRKNPDLSRVVEHGPRRLRDCGLAQVQPGEGDLSSQKLSPTTSHAFILRFHLA